MDGLLVVLAIVMWVISQSSKKRKKNKSTQQTKQMNAAQRRADRLAQMHAEIEKRRTERAEQQITKTEQPSFGEGESSFLHVQPETTETLYTGSLQAESTEGECICDPALEHTREEQPEGVYADEIGREPLVDFSAKGVLQGVVMSEILKRPSQRASYHRRESQVEDG